MAIGLALGLLSAEAQRAKIPRIGVLDGNAPNNPRTCTQFLRRGLSDLGYIEGQLVQLNVDLIVSAAGPAAIAVKQATASIPVVLASSLYPVETGIVAASNILEATSQG